MRHYFYNKKVFIFDVDNTVCESCQPISAKMHDILYKLSSYYTIAFISGTDYAELNRMLKLSFQHYLLPLTGSQIYLVWKYTHSSLIYTKTLLAEDRLLVLDAVIKAIQKFNLIPEDAHQILLRYPQVTLSCIGRYANSENKANWDPDKTKRHEIVNFLKELLPDFSILIGGTTSIDILPGHINKFTSLENLIQYLQIDKKECLFFGDQLQPGGNDYAVKMLMDCIEVTSPTDTLKILESIT